MSNDKDRKPDNLLQRTSKKGWMSTLFALIFFVIIFLIVRYTGFFKSISFTSNQEGLVFSGPAGDSLTVPYTDVESIEYISVPDYGTPTDQGGEKNHCRFGIWTSNSYNRYTAFTSTRIAPCALIRTGSGIILFNYENEETTRQFVDIYSEYCRERREQ